MHMQRADQIDGDEPLPLRRFGLGEGAKNVPAGIIHQHINGPEAGFRRTYRSLDTASVRDVATEGLSDAAVLANGGGDPFRRVEIEIEYGDPCAFMREPVAGRTAYAAAASRDDDRPAIETHDITSHLAPVLPGSLPPPRATRLVRPRII